MGDPSARVFGLFLIVSQPFVEDIREMGKPPETPNPKPEREMGRREKKPRNQRGKWEKERRNPETREENGKKKRTGREKEETGREKGKRIFPYRQRGASSTRRTLDFDR